MRLISERLVEELLPLELAVQSADEAFRALSSGQAIVPLRGEIPRPGQGIVMVMSGVVGDRDLAVKTIGSVANADDPGSKHTTCMMLVWDARTLKVRGLIAADTLNEHRTAAGMALAARELARPDSKVHLLVGAGKLAWTALLHTAMVRPLTRTILLSRSRDKVQALAQRAAADPRLKHMDIVTDMDPGEAVRQADIITTVTTSDTPVFDGSQVRPGTHINLGGAFRPTSREMDDAAAARASVWLDDSAACRVRSGDVVMALASGSLTEQRIRGEIGAMLLGKVPGRQSAEEVTVFKSLGVAVQDIVLGARLMDLADARGLGVVFDESGA